MALELERKWPVLNRADMARLASEADEGALNPPEAPPPFHGADELWDELCPPPSPGESKVIQDLLDDAQGGEILKEAVLPPGAKPLGFENSVMWSNAVDELRIPGFKFLPSAGGAPPELLRALEGRQVDGVIRITLPRIDFSPQCPWAPGASRSISIPAGDYLVVGLEQAGGRLYSSEAIQSEQIRFLHIVPARCLPGIETPSR